MQAPNPIGFEPIEAHLKERIKGFPMLLKMSKSDQDRKGYGCLKLWEIVKLPNRSYNRDVATSFDWILTNRGSFKRAH